MINKSNIRNYVEFLHFKKYDIGPKEDLLDRWANLSDFEITKQLSGLYQHWEIAPDVAQKYEQAFLAKSKISFATSSSSDSLPVDEGDYLRYTKEPSNISNRLIVGIVVCLLAAGFAFYFSSHKTDLTKKTEQLEQQLQQIDQKTIIEQQTRLAKEENSKRAEHERLNQIKVVKADIEAYVLHKVNYSYDGTFGGVKNVDIWIKNNSDFKMNELTLKLYYIKKNGDVYETKDITFYNLLPKEEKHMPGPTSKRGTRMKAKITGVQIDN